MKKQIIPCLWFDGNAQAAAEFYCSVFPASKILESSPIVVTFEINGNAFMGLNGGNRFTFNDSISFVVPCETQDEIDYYWERLTEGGRESMCGWLVDKFGVSWQIIPDNMDELMSDPPRSQRIMNAVMNMRKLNIDVINKA